MGKSAFAALRSNSGANDVDELIVHTNDSSTEGTEDGETQSISTSEVEAASSGADKPDDSAFRLKIPAQVFSTWSPSEKGALEICEESRVRLSLKPETQITIIGQYDLLVVKGTVRVYGATLDSQDGFVSLTTPATHALPSIECISKTPATIELWHKRNSLRGVGKMLPLFQHIWNQNGSFEQRSILDCPQIRSFSVIFNSADDKRPLYPLQYPSSWRSCNDEITRSMKANKNSSRVLIHGGKSSGKSSLARLLSNHLLSTRVDMHKSKGKLPEYALPMLVKSIFWLDLDPGQPEFSPPGQISLVHVKRPILGTPFTHSSNHAPSSYDIVRAHCLGTTDASADDVFYWEAIRDLGNVYEQESKGGNNSSLVINCPGYDPQSRFGSRLVHDLGTIMKANYTILLADDGTVQDNLSSGKNATQVNCRPFTLPSCPSYSKLLNFSAAQLRSMQTASYFHCIGNQKWNASTLSQFPAWKLRYSGNMPDIVGVTTVVEHPARASLLKTIIHKWILGICVIEDDNEIQKAMTVIQRTKEDDLPYLYDDRKREAYRPPVSSSRLIGWGFVRAIEVENGTLDIVTPIPHEIRSDLLNKTEGSYPRILLIRGPTDTPEWAYMEEMLSKTNRSRSSKAVDDEEALELDDSRLLPEFGKVSKSSTSLDSIDYLESSKNRMGLEGRVWKPTPRISEPLPKRVRTE